MKKDMADDENSICDALLERPTSKYLTGELVYKKTLRINKKTVYPHSTFINLQ